MRHRKKRKVLNRGTSELRLMLKNMAASFFIYEKIRTTETKAKLIKPILEKIITIGKKNDLASRRKILKLMSNNALASKIIKNISTKYINRPGGYTRIIKLGRRKGDNAKIVEIKLV